MMTIGRKPLPSSGTAACFGAPLSQLGSFLRRACGPLEGVRPFGSSSPEAVPLSPSLCGGGGARTAEEAAGPGAAECWCGLQLWELQVILTGRAQEELQATPFGRTVQLHRPMDFLDLEEAAGIRVVGIATLGCEDWNVGPTSVIERGCCTLFFGVLAGRVLDPDALRESLGCLLEVRESSMDFPCDAWPAGAGRAESGLPERFADSVLGTAQDARRAGVKRFLNLRSRFRLNVVGVRRRGLSIWFPAATFVLKRHDVLLFPRLRGLDSQGLQSFTAVADSSVLHSLWHEGPHALGEGQPTQTHRRMYIDILEAYAAMEGVSKSKPKVRVRIGYQSPLAINAEQEPGEHEAQLMALHNACRHHNAIGELCEKFTELFSALPDEAVLRVRAAFDADLVFSPDGTHVDLRHIIFDKLSHAERESALQRIRHACTTPSDSGLVVLTDVDDTLLPATNILGGRDKGWPTDGRFYPGVCQLHRVLRGKCGTHHNYLVLLTARPPRLVCHLPAKFEQLTDMEHPRMAILPGADGLHMLKNAAGILVGQYKALGRTKFKRLQEYAALFPEYGGRFVFIGDDGQADLHAARKMLDLKSPTLDTPLIAFIAIKAVKETTGALCPEHQRSRIVEELRAQYPQVGNDHGELHRFFYFDTYEDLALQLSSAGWISSSQQHEVRRESRREASLSKKWERTFAATSVTVDHSKEFFRCSFSGATYVFIIDDKEMVQIRLFTGDDVLIGEALLPLNQVDGALCTTKLDFRVGQGAVVARLVIMSG